MRPEQPCHTDLEYYEGRAGGVPIVDGVTLAEAKLDLARSHGFTSWDEREERVAAIREGREPAPPFILAYEALEARDTVRLTALFDADPGLVHERGTNGNDLLGMASLEHARLLLARGADPNR